MATVNGISDLPGIAQPDVDPAEASSSFLTRYFGGYEQELGLAILRPVKVAAVRREDADPRPAPADHHLPRRLVRPGRNQRHRHLDPAVLAHLPGPGPPSGAGSCMSRTTSRPKNSAAGT